jgi:hypothetical protein
VLLTRTRKHTTVSADGGMNLKEEKRKEDEKEEK